MASNHGDDLSRHRLRFSDMVDEPLRMLPPIEGFQKMPLVSLEEAVKPLIKHILDVERYALDAKKKSQEPSDYGLSIDECASIRLYTMEWTTKEQSLYFIMNDKLRSEDRSILKDWFLYLKLILTGLMKIPSSRQNLFRGVNLNLSAKYQQGVPIIWWAFSSCTDSMEVVKHFCGKTGERTIFEINCYSGKDVRKYSDYIKENEVLLIAATQFELVAKVDKGDGLTIIQLKETEPLYPLIEKGPIPNHSATLLQQLEFKTPIKSPVHFSKTEQPQNIPSLHISAQSDRNPEIRRQIDRIQPRSQAIIEGQR
ncbi:unnamed protein product, partial [Rotaria sp. Silwood2]